MANPKDDKPKTFDVSKPGKTPAEATSRPVIVGHGSRLKDPMVSQNSPMDTPKPTDSTTAKPAVKSGAAGKKTIKPLGDFGSVADPDLPAEVSTDKKGLSIKIVDSATEPSEPADDKATSTVPTPKPEEPSTGSENTKPSEPKEPTVDDKEAETSPEPQKSTSIDKDKPMVNSESAVIDAIAKDVGGKKSKKELEEEQARAESINKIVEAGTYSLPIHAKRSTTMVKVVLVFVLLALIGLVLAIDAGIIDPADSGLSIDLPFDLL